MSSQKSAKSPLLILFLVVFIDLLGFGIVIPILPYYARQYGASATVLGLLMMSYSAMQVVFAPVWGKISDSVGRRPILLMSILGTGLAFLILGFARTLAMLFVGRLFAGLCGANISTAAAYIADSTSEENRAKGMGMIGAAFGLGFVCGPALGGMLSVWGYDAPMFAAAILAGLNFVFAYLALPEPLKNKIERAKNRVNRWDRETFASVFSRPRVRSAILIFFVTTLAVTQMEATFALYMLDEFHYNARQAGVMLGAVGLIMVVIQGGLIGRASKKYGEVALISFGSVALGVGLVGFGLAPSLRLVMTALGAMAIGQGFLNPSLSSLCSKAAESNRKGATMGFYHSAGSMARVIGPPAAGLFYDKLGHHSPFTIAGVFMLVAFAISRLTLARNAK